MHHKQRKAYKIIHRRQCQQVDLNDNISKLILSQMNCSQMLIFQENSKKLLQLDTPINY